MDGVVRAGVGVRKSILALFISTYDLEAEHLDGGKDVIISGKRAKLPDNQRLVSLCSLTYQQFPYPWMQPPAR